MFFRLEARAQAKAVHDAARDELIQLSASKSTQWRAARAKELQGVMADAAKTMKAAPAVVVTDPQAAALSHYLGGRVRGHTGKRLDLAHGVHGELL